MSDATIRKVGCRGQGALNTKPKTAKKPEAIVGYVLLIVGLMVLIIPTCLSVMIIFGGGSAVPEILEAPDVSFNDFNFRVVAIDNNDATYTTNDTMVMCGESQERITHIIFRNISLAKIKEFQFQIRPYEWVTFNNVSLLPDVKKKVKITIREIPGRNER